MPPKLVIPEQPDVNIGTVGHVDHGKTTLIQGLTGIWTSTHSEELRRGITIKIGYADMPIYECPSLEGPKRFSVTPEVPGCQGEIRFKRAVSFVDCPGHESLMANMLSGAAVMNAAIMVIAADEPVPRPQTREHMVAIEILGVDKVIVVQNKVDLVSKEEALENYRQIEEFLSGTVAEGSPIIPVSAVYKVNLEYVLEALAEYIPTPERDYSKPAQLFVIRSFDINVPGTPYDKLRGGVLGGSIIQGVLREGDEIEILPGYLEKRDGRIVHEPLYTEVLSLHSQNLKLKEAKSGGLIGVQTDLDPALTKADGLVGNVAGKPGALPKVLYDFDMDVQLFQYVVGTDETVPVDKIVENEALRLNVGSSVTLAMVSGIREDVAHVRLVKPVTAGPGWKAAIARRVGGKWRLIGVGDIMG